MIVIYYFNDRSTGTYFSELQTTKYIFVKKKNETT